MTAYIIRRVLWLIPVLFAVSVITFGLMHAVEGGPWDANSKLSASDRARLDARYGLDEPLWKQYTQFVGNALQGDFGISFRQTTRDVRTIIWEGFKVSALLGGMALVVSVVIGVPLGMLSALNRNGLWDYVGVFVATAGAAVPSFVLGIYLILIFSVNLELLPVQGWGSPKQAVLPVITAAVLPLAYIARITRVSMLDVLNEDYIRTARAKGLAPRVVILRHVMRNAMIPILTVLGPIAAVELTGSFIIESMFGIPGVGRQFIQSISSRDYGMIMGTTLFFCVAIAFANLLVDAAYAFVDPRIKQS